MKRILIVTDAWHPQVNGVVRCLDNIGDELRSLGHVVDYLTPERFWTMPLPTYPEIRISLAHLGHVEDVIDEVQPHFIHIATEGPLGLLARQVCLNRHLPFTTSYHTRFAEYIAARLPVPAEWSYAYLRWFHEAAARTMVPTQSVVVDLAQWGFQGVVPWTRGVDRAQFFPARKTLFGELPGPHMVCVGRVAVEKNVEAFLQLDMPGSKIVVGDGPQLDELRARYPEAHFVGQKTGAELAAHYQSADVFVFPSKTDTFGNVMLEAMACGVPVAAYPVIGPIDVLTDPLAGRMNERLDIAVTQALSLRREDVLRHAARFTWAECAKMFFDYLAPIDSEISVAA